MSALTGEQRFRWSELTPALALLTVMLFGLAWAFLTPTGQNDQYIVVVAPWSDLNTTLSTIQAASGKLLSISNSVATIITVHSERQDFPSALHSAGLWLVFEPGQLGGCISAPQKAVTL